MNTTNPPTPPLLQTFISPADKPVTLVIKDKNLVWTILNPNIIYQGEKMLILGTLNMICQVRSWGGWSGIGMANFRFFKSEI